MIIHGNITISERQTKNILKKIRKYFASDFCWSNFLALWQHSDFIHASFVHRLETTSEYKSILDKAAKIC